MRSNSGLASPSLSGGRLEAYEAATVRGGFGLFIALALHGAFLLYAYLHPPPPGPKKSQPIEMLVVVRKPPEPPPPPEKPPEVIPPPPEAATPPPTRAPSRPLPRELAPVARKDDTPDAKSSAIVVPVQPDRPAEPNPPGGVPKGPIDLFPKNLGTIVGAPTANAPIPKGPDRLFKDERLEPKKEPRFELLPDKGGGYKCETKTFIAHIAPDGKVTFDDRFPIGFEKGGTFSFDLTDLAMRGKKIDPYAAEKRRFLDFSDKVRSDLRKKAADENRTQALSTFRDQLAEVWNSSRSAAARRRDLYEKWADSDEKDELGRKGRHAVEDFIRGHLPQGSSSAYTDEELQKIAGERHGLVPFDPYGTGTP